MSSSNKGQEKSKHIKRVKVRKGWQELWTNSSSDQESKEIGRYASVLKLQQKKCTYTLKNEKEGYQSGSNDKSLA